jgi:hypothetical protein
MKVYKFANQKKFWHDYSVSVIFHSKIKENETKLYHVSAEPVHETNKRMQSEKRYILDQQGDVVVVCILGLMYIFCQFKARIPEFDAVFSVQCTLYSLQLRGEGGGVVLRVKFWYSSLKYVGWILQAQHTMTTSLCWSHNTSSLGRHTMKGLVQEKKIYVT